MATKQPTSSEEKWKPVVGWEGIYAVSDCGRVKSLPRWVRSRNRHGVMVCKRRGMLLKPASEKYGHQRVCLTAHGNFKRYYVHQLVLTAFVGPCPKGMECCHQDGNPKNNAPSNLRWDSRKANMEDSVRHGTAIGPRGELAHAAKLNPRKVRLISALLADGVSQRKIAARFGVSQATIWAIGSGHSWAHVAQRRVR